MHTAIGKRIKDLWGRVLFETCHMGPEQCVYSNAIMDLLVHWMPDCRQLLSERVFDSKRHLRKLGLEASLPGVPDWPVECERPPPFARTFAITPTGSQVRARVGLAVLLVGVGLIRRAALPARRRGSRRDRGRRDAGGSRPAFAPGGRLPSRSARGQSLAQWSND